MKKVFSFLAVLALVCMATSAWAADTVITTLTKSSIADFSSQGTVSFDITLKKISDDSSASTIDWDVANITLNQTTTNWTTSTVYAQISATVTKNNGAIYMYQNNTAAGTYQASSPRVVNSSNTYSGLVNTATHGGNDGRGFIPLVFQITTTKATPNFGTAPESVAGTRYFTDISDQGYSANYVTIANINGLVAGINDDGCYGFEGKPFSGYMYFGGLFSDVRGGDIYGTDTIQFVSHVE